MPIPAIVLPLVDGDEPPWIMLTGVRSLKSSFLEEMLWVACISTLTEKMNVQTLPSSLMILAVVDMGLGDTQSLDNILGIVVGYN